MPSGDETYSNFKQFINSIDDEQSFLLTFDQEVAYKHRDIVFVNLYNPIIQAALQFFAQQTDNPDRTFKFDVKQSEMGSNIQKGRYFLAVYQVETSKFIFGTKKNSNTLHPILYDIQQGKVIEDEELTNTFFGKSQVKGEYQRSENAAEISASVITDMQFDLAETIDKYRNAYAAELKLQADNSVLMMRQQTEAFYKYRINNMKTAVKNAEDRLELAMFMQDEKEIRNAEANVRLQSNNLRSLERQQDEELQRVSQDHQLEVRTHLLSINYINVK